MNSAASRILTRLWLVIVAVLVIGVLFLAKVLFLPMAFAVLFAFLLAPLVNWLERVHLPRSLAAILVHHAADGDAVLDARHSFSGDRELQDV